MPVRNAVINFFYEVSQVSGTLTVKAVKGSHFQGHLKTFVERRKSKYKFIQLGSL